ncbi:signal peptidase II [Candidatus Williamhamiltonella defendens]|uniref:signal peptidase II n=1 Tax=Candidatus Williamhamiltonella defendens TaxID=138072 RepID=UPI00165117B8|nr:signal peptidase II [Candidatus Hamiltonella defensa]
MNRSMGITQLCWLCLSVVVIVLDLASKYWIIYHFDLYEIRPLIPFLNITYAQNTGAAFSFLADRGGWQRWFFILIAIVMIAILMRLMYRSIENKWIIAAYALIIGGALGNLCDRIAHGFVIDFIDFYVNQWHWPTFNVADSAICIGALFILLEGFLNPALKKQISQKEK